MFIGKRIPWQKECHQRGYGGPHAKVPNQQLSGAWAIPSPPRGPPSARIQILLLKDKLIFIAILWGLESSLNDKIDKILLDTLKVNE
jgi:hypothetical protein